MTIEIVTADDHGALRGGLRDLLNAEPDLRVIGEAPDGDQAISIAETLRPDVLVTDISMPGPNGIEIARALSDRVPSTHVLILRMHEDASLVREALEAGAKGYLPKRYVDGELVKAVRSIASGAYFVLPHFDPSANLNPESKRPADVIELTAQELDLLRLIVHGDTSDKIANALNLRPDDVPNFESLVRTIGSRSYAMPMTIMSCDR